MAHVIDNFGRLHALEELPEGGGVFGRLVIGQINDAVANDMIAYDTSGDPITPNIGANEVSGRVGAASVSGVSMTSLHSMLQGQEEYYIPLVSDGVEHSFTRIVTKTGNYTALSSDRTILCNAAAGAFTITLPPASTVKGNKVYAKKIDSTANAVTISASPPNTIDDSLSKVLSSQYDSATLEPDNVRWFIL